MTQHFSKIIALGLVLFCARSFCVAQVDSWERLSSVESGSKLIVALTNGDAMEGRLREWSPAGLTILHKNGVLSVPKTDIRKIMLVSRRSRLRIGGGLATIGGAVGGALFGAVCASRGNCGASPAALAGGAAFIAVQAASGSDRFGHQQSHVIYLTDGALHAEGQE